MKEREDVLVQLGNLSRKPISILRVLQEEIIRSELGERKIDEKDTLGKKKSQEEKSNEVQDGAYVIV